MCWQLLIVCKLLQIFSPARSESFGQIIRSKVIYIELAGRRNSDLKGYNHFGLVVTTEGKRFWLAHGSKGKSHLTFIRNMGSRWVILYGRKVRGKTVGTYFTAAKKFEGLSSPAVALKKMLKLPGVVIETNAWIRMENNNVIEWSLRQNYMNTWDSCISHRVSREQYFSTGYIPVPGIKRIDVNITYQTEACKSVMETGCNGNIEVFIVKSRDKVAPPEFIYFNHTHDRVKKLGSLAIISVNADIGKLHFIHSVDVQSWNFVAIGFIDRGVCMEIYNLTLSAFICKSHEEELAHYQQVYAPVKGISRQNGTCLRNAIPKTPRSIEWNCSADGSAFFAEGCTCEKGYHVVNSSCVVGIYTDEKKIKIEDNKELLANAKKTKEEKKTTIIILSTIVPVCILIIVLVVVATFWWRKWTKGNKMFLEPITIDMDDNTTTYIPENESYRRLMQKQFIDEEDTFSISTEGPYINPEILGQNDYPVYHNIDHYEFPPERLKIIQTLGQGFFGSVQLAEAQNISGWNGFSNVAVKTLKENAKEKYGEAFLLELDLLRNLEPHDNIVRLLGCCTAKGPAHIIFEYMEKGDLLTLLKSCRKPGPCATTTSTLPFTELLNFSSMIAKGMQHLGENKIVHRDLAARNVLVDHNLVCKVSDFGLARRLNEDDLYRKGPEQAKLPLEWMAPESVWHGTYSINSDVWSFGVVLWEMFSYGEKPYPGHKVQDVLLLLEENYRMSSPLNCPKEVYQIMLSCWDEEPLNRPPFSQLIEVFAMEELIMGAS